MLQPRIYVQLTDLKYIKETVIIDSNVDDLLLISAVRNAQEIEIQKVLGTKLYNKIMSDLSSNSLANQYENLLYDYIQIAHCNWTLYHSFVNLEWKLTNKSVSEKSSDNSQATDKKNISFLRENTRLIAESYSQRMTDIIIANIGDFPEYETSGCSTNGNISPDKNQYFSGMQLI